MDIVDKLMNGYLSRVNCYLKLLRKIQKTVVPFSKSKTNNVIEVNYFSLITEAI